MNEEIINLNFYDWAEQNVDWKAEPYFIARLAYRAGYAQAEADAAGKE